MAQSTILALALLASLAIAGELIWAFTSSLPGWLQEASCRRSRNASFVWTA
jgi:hypothetical protein